ncbi:hypothetical protein U9M48_029850 [Paspalum notatum var. saurae]|uniref:non-specific serine/threonine protein kinase n=1 Tax=Paspalum notatum var. saurae TaxID=547442 RepID=A0AAQ3X2N8_PASNO
MTYENCFVNTAETSGYDWCTRYKIIRGICYGLHYLHEECRYQFNASIIHLDLKPANILLTENVVPKVADFGLSRLFEDNKTQTCASSVLGSLGYMAPEYLIGRIVTPMADIHSLGVIIIEIITGSKINILSFSSETSRQDFVEDVLEKWRNRLKGILSATDYKQIKSCLEIGLSCKKLTFAELETATKGFSLEAKIGEGSFGTVYRGKLPNGREVAINNLVELVGYCQENEELLLVYEYMENGALYDHLHSSAPNKAKTPLTSSWKLRIKMLLVASRGINYLHTYARLFRVHGNIKTRTARVSDFAEAPDLTTKLNPSTAGSSAAGHIADPEYHSLGTLTTKSDVYGFGVVMLEVLTGKADDDEGTDTVSVVDYAVPRIVAGELFKVLDVPAAHEAEAEAEAVQLVAYTALHCVSPKGKDRPEMANIVASLECALALTERIGRSLA